MQSRNSTRPQLRRLPNKRKQSSKTTPKICLICKQPLSENEQLQDNQCPTCFQSLFYYLYVNMHLFVEPDHSFQARYFTSKHPEPQPLSLSRKMSADTQVSEPDQEQPGQSFMRLSWIDTLLAGQ